MVNTNKLKLTGLQQQILRLLFIKAGTTLNAHTISRLLEVSQPAVSKALPLLEKKGFLLIQKNEQSKQLSIEINREYPSIIGLKRADNLKQIYESGFAQFIFENLPGATVIIFGSYALGEDTINSDIDLAVIGSKEKRIALDKFEETLGRKIIINYYKSFKDINKHLLNNILNGILIKGAIEL